MTTFIIIYLLGYLISFPIGIYLTKESMPNSKTPVFDKRDLNDRNALRNMSIFIISISSWIIVFCSIIYLLILLVMFFNKRLTKLPDCKT